VLFPTIPVSAGKRGAGRIRHCAELSSSGKFRNISCVGRHDGLPRGFRVIARANGRRYVLTYIRLSTLRHGLQLPGSSQGKGSPISKSPTSTSVHSTLAQPGSRIDGAGCEYPLLETSCLMSVRDLLRSPPWRETTAAMICIPATEGSLLGRNWSVQDPGFSLDAVIKICMWHSSHTLTSQHMSRRPVLRGYSVPGSWVTEAGATE
jgi:hypothetical protein